MQGAALRFMQVLVVVMGVLIVVGVIVIGVTIAQRLSNSVAEPEKSAGPPPPATVSAEATATPSETPPSTAAGVAGPAGPVPSSPTHGEPRAVTPLIPFGESVIDLPLGWSVRDWSSDGDRLLVELETQEGETALQVISLRTGTALGVIRWEAQ